MRKLLKEKKKIIPSFRWCKHCNVNTGQRTIWQNVGIRSFYGPWNIAAKQNGDYVDYNDYGVHVAHFRPNSLELPYDDVSITNGYIDELPSVYDSNLPEFNTLLSSVGLADFRIGVRTGDWIDRNTDGTTERYWEDIASQKTDEDTEEPEDSAIPNAARQWEILYKIKCLINATYNIHLGYYFKFKKNANFTKNSNKFDTRISFHKFLASVLSSTKLYLNLIISKSN